MNIVVDTNILFSFFWEESFTKKLILNIHLNLISPEIALDELNKYRLEIIRKTKISKRGFIDNLHALKSIVRFIDKETYSKFIQEARLISSDEKDADFFALCLKENCFLWSNDNLLKNQNKINVLSTEEVINFLF